MHCLCALLYQPKKPQNRTFYFMRFREIWSFALEKITQKGPRKNKTIACPIASLHAPRRLTYIHLIGTALIIDHNNSAEQKEKLKILYIDMKVIARDAHQIHIIYLEKALHLARRLTRSIFFCYTHRTKRKDNAVLCKAFFFSLYTWCTCSNSNTIFNNFYLIDQNAKLFAERSKYCLHCARSLESIFFLLVIYFPLLKTIEK